MSTVILFVLGLVLLLIGAELLVRGASRLAAAFGISPLVIGLTVVAFGTSSPELAVSLQGALAGASDVAVGNVVGSNVFNVLFILGLSAAITPLVVAQQLVRIDVPIMVGVSVLTLVLALDGRIGTWDGVLLAALLVAYMGLTVVRGRRESPAVTQEYAAEYGPPARPRRLLQAVFILVGLGLLVLGARWLVEGATAFARLLGLSELVISLTIVAAGTSLPEVATSVVASVRGERDIAVGNVVGSNIFNLLGVLGLSAALAPSPLTVPAQALAFDLPVMTAVAVACLPIFFTGWTIARWEGFLFLGYYVAYVAWLVLRAMEHALLGVFTGVMLLFVIPLTAITLAVVVLRAVRPPRRTPG